MFDFNLKSANEQHMVALASKRLCAGESYWSMIGFTGNNEQDPIKMASFSKEFGTH